MVANTFSFLETTGQNTTTAMDTLDQIRVIPLYGDLHCFFPEACFHTDITFPFCSIAKRPDQGMVANIYNITAVDLSLFMDSKEEIMALFF